MNRGDTARSAAEETVLVSSCRRGGDVPTPALPVPTEQTRQSDRHSGTPSSLRTKAEALKLFPFAGTASSIPHGQNPPAYPPLSEGAVHTIAAERFLLYR